MRPHTDPASALTPWSREAQRSDDAFSELDAILEGPRLTVAEATTQLEGVISRARRGTDRLPGFQIEWTRGVVCGPNARDYRSSPETSDAGTLRVRFRAVPAGGIGWPIAVQVLLLGSLLATSVSGDPRWLGGVLLAGLIGLALHAREDHELSVGSGGWRLTRGALWKETLELDPASRLRSHRVNDAVWLVAVAPRGAVIGSVSPSEVQITELPSLLDAFRSLERAQGVARSHEAPSGGE